jgi:TPR repeat protein
MMHTSKVLTDATEQMPRSTSARPRPGILNAAAVRRAASAILLVILFGAGTMRCAFADGLTRGTSAYVRGDYVRAVRELTAAASRGNARAQGRLGFMYENGFGVPQNYAAAADLYRSAAAQGDTFAQSRLGLSYDKGHGVPQSAILSYKWLDLAAAKAPSRQRDFYRRLRDAVASKMSSDQIVEGQRLALMWAQGRW